MQMPPAIRFLWLFCLVVASSRVVLAGNEEHLRELVATETSLIDALREYIDGLEQQLLALKQETLAIEELHQLVGDQVEEYIGNPLNVLTILKRFQSVWPKLERQANATLELGQDMPDYEMELPLPSEEEYETALLNLLRLQSVYELEPATLSLGIVNGLKLGSAMSWSDCLEMARKSDRNGDYAVAKYWVETALGKLPAAAGNATHGSSISEHDRGRVQILEASVNMDYRAGEFLSALATAKELLLLRPTNQNVQKAKAKIERAISGAQTKSKAKLSKSVEQLLIDELCRSATRQQVTTGSRLLECRQDVSHLRMLRLEQLSEDPHITLYHNVLSFRQADKLITLLDDKAEQHTKVAATFAPMELSKLGQKMLRGINYQLANVGHPEEPLSLPLWQARRHSHEHVTATEVAEAEHVQHVARAMLQLHEPKLGGALVFPQLELGVNVPRGSLLHWRTRSISESHSRLDYRSRQLVCPVLLGSQLSLWTELN
ncbi:prolyl 4-hydroxylase subunit alpha-2 [Drosophila sulfurigaster albostrigata]|uniref:prolyl 4-hydroxylase subunit alpha-2 n=1 Tax=Drosophila sulfurigaster albostrigata TaxID=89887 RepID=UPI002D2193AC|nr:prolyl 4-hydroxylase subunit alpha-2 [Drosophila sulfurigaster albostrigata]